MRLVPIYEKDKRGFINQDYVSPVLVALDNDSKFAVSTMPLELGVPHNLLAISQHERLIETGLQGLDDQVAPYPAVTKLILDVLGRTAVIDVSRLGAFTFGDTDEPTIQTIVAKVEYKVDLSSIFVFVRPEEKRLVNVLIMCDGRVDLSTGAFAINASARIESVQGVTNTLRTLLEDSFKPVGFDLLANRTPKKYGRV